MVKYVFVAVALTASLLLACSNDRPVNVATNNTSANAVKSPIAPLPSATLDEVAAGRKVYEANCAGCHKEDGSGGPMENEGKKLNPDDLTEDKFKKMTDEKILGYIVNGVEDEGMPAFKGKLSEGEMRDVVRYIRTEIQKNPGTAVAPPKS